MESRFSVPCPRCYGATGRECDQCRGWGLVVSPEPDPDWIAMLATMPAPTDDDYLMAMTA
jgi:hypothetical protein